MNNPLHQHIASNLHYQQDEVLEKFVDVFKEEYKESLLAVVFYGSCMRSREYKDAMLDFYVIVDSYRHAYASRWFAIANKLLAPNVFYQQVQLEDCVYRAKYAVVSKTSLISSVEKSFHPYFWARFTQPIAYIYACDKYVKEWLTKIQCQSAATFIHSVRYAIHDEYCSENLWVAGMQLTYSAELRTETSQRADYIYQSQRNYYDGITHSVFPNKNSRNFEIKKSEVIKWKLRKALGKVLSILRLMKATTTFINGVDYLAWKIERHTGEKLIVSEKLRKHPLIYCWPLLIKLYRQGKIR